MLKDRNAKAFAKKLVTFCETVQASVEVIDAAEATEASLDETKRKLAAADKKYTEVVGATMKAESELEDQSTKLAELAARVGEAEEWVQVVEIEATQRKAIAVEAATRRQGEVLELTAKVEERCEEAKAELADLEAAVVERRAELKRLLGE